MSIQAAGELPNGKDVTRAHRGASGIVSGQAGLVAAVDIIPGDLILSKQRPLLVVLDSESVLDACANCFKYSPRRPEEGPDRPRYDEEALGDFDRLMSCAACKTTKYCSKV